MSNKYNSLYWWDDKKTHHTTEEKLLELNTQYPLSFSESLIQEINRHQIEKHDYFRDFMEISKAKGNKFTLLIFPALYSMYSWVDNFNKQYKKYPNCSTVNYFKFNFTKDSYYIEETIIFIFSDYPDQEQKLINLFKEFYNIRSFM